jgi:outer membrane protein assembly factor BamB
MKRVCGLILGTLLLAGLGAYAHVSRHAVSVVAPPSADRTARQLGPSLDAPDWPCWRGPLGTGHGLTARPPQKWSESDGVKWKVALPGCGHGSPIVCGDRVLLATADEANQSISMLAIRRGDGSPLWTTAVQHGGLMAKHEKNSHASATPACDGRCAFLPFIAEDSLWLVAVNLDGSQAWRARVGPFHSQWGYGSSPVYWRGLVIVAGDNKGSRLADLAATTSYLAALDAQTGEVVWRVRRPREHSYGTPIVGEIAGRSQLLLGGHESVRSYDPATGEELWWCTWPVGRMAGTIAFDTERIFASGTFPSQEVVCVRADGHGDVTDTHVVWRQRRGAADVPSPLLIDGRLLLIGDHGVVTCLAADTGRSVWQQRLSGAFWASPVAANGLVYAVNEDGRTHVIRVGKTFESVAENQLDGVVHASPALAGNELYLRTDRSLYRLAAP